MDFFILLKYSENDKINEIERTRVRSPPRATSFFKKTTSKNELTVGA
jgi:hypothetical protein